MAKPSFDTARITVGHPCLHCGALVHLTEQSCPSCGRESVAGCLISRGTGVIRQGEAIELRPVTYRFGRDPAHNDVAIPSNLVPRRVAHLRYESGGFILTGTSTNSCRVNGEPVPGSGARLVDGDIVTIAFDEFEYQSSGAAPIVGNDGRFLQAVSTLLAEANSTADIIEIFDGILDAILAVSGLERAFAYLPADLHDPSSELAVVSGRTQDHQAWTAEGASNHGFCQALLQECHDEMYPVIILRAQEGSIPDPEGVGHRAVIAIPLCIFDPDTGKRKVRGILYADSLTASAAVHELVEPTLGIIAQIATMTIIDHENENRRDHPQPDALAARVLTAMHVLRDEIDQDDDIPATSKIVIWHRLDEIAKLGGVEMPAH
jgi:hypothetical protein